MTKHIIPILKDKEFFKNKDGSPLTFDNQFASRFFQYDLSTTTMLQGEDLRNEFVNLSNKNEYT